MQILRAGTTTAALLAGAVGRRSARSESVIFSVIFPLRRTGGGRRAAATGCCGYDLPPLALTTGIRGR
ncbi:hypothetical protein MJ579_06560 [Klebsiella pneumoniae]|nr:hypothetical protein MJ579_06560 [Klebsiella pneumoniae]